MAAADAAAATAAAVATTATPPPAALTATTPTTSTAHLLFSAALLPVVKVVMMCSVGAYFAYEKGRSGVDAGAAILDAPGRKRLAALSYSLLTPALAFTSLAPTLTRDHLLAWLPLGINLLTSVALGLALGWLVCRLFAVPAELRGVVTAATALGNAGNLPLVLMAAVVRQAGAKTLGWTDEGLEGGGAGGAAGAAAVSPEAAMQRRAVSYVAVNILASICTHFTIGTRLLGGSSEGNSAAAAAPTGGGENGGAAATKPRRPTSSGGDDDQRPGRDGGGGDRRALLPTAPPPRSPPGLSPRRGGAASAPSFQPLEAAETGPRRSPRDTPPPPPPPALALEVGSPPPPSAAPSAPSFWAGRVITALPTFARELAKPPLLACFLAAAVGLGPPTPRELLFPPPPSTPGAPAHTGLLAIAADAARAFADATVPLLMLLLGATLTGVATASTTAAAGNAAAANAAAAPLPTRVVAGVVAARLVVLPLLGLAFVLTAYRIGLFPSPPPDRAFVIVLVLTHAVPTALNVHALSVLFCGPRAQAAMARLVLAQYLACVVTIPPALGVALAAARGDWV